MVTINTLNGGNITITAGGSAPAIDLRKTRVIYTTESGHDDWSSEIVGTLTQNSIPNTYDIKTVDIGTSVTSIGDSAFTQCNGLISITIPETVGNIEEWAFGHCTGLTSITIPSSVNSIGDYAF